MRDGNKGAGRAEQLLGRPGDRTARGGKKGLAVFFFQKKPQYTVELIAMSFLIPIEQQETCHLFLQDFQENS
jgi:hypothetical protein